MNIWKELLYTLLFILWDSLVYVILMSLYEFNLIESIIYYPLLQFLSKLIFYISLLLIIFRKFNLDFQNKIKIDYSLVFVIFIIVVGQLLINRILFDFYYLIFDNNHINNRINQKIDISPLNNIIYYIGILIIAPIGEELFFRKYLFTNLLKKNSLKTSILISSICFAIIHLPIYNNLFPTFFLGITSAFILYKTHKIIYSIFFHFIYNLVISIIPLIMPNYNLFMIENKFGIIYFGMIILGIMIFYFGIKKFLKSINAIPETKN